MVGRFDSYVCVTCLLGKLFTDYTDFHGFLLGKCFLIGLVLIV